MSPLQLKQEFPSLKAFKDALYIWAIAEHFEPRILKSDSHHVRVGCKFDPKCEFSIRCNAYNAGPRTPNPFAKITVLRHEHTCTPQDPTNPLNRQVANRIPWLVENVPRFLDVTPTTTIESIQEAILTHSGYTVNLQQIRRVRRLLVKGKDFRSPQRDHGVGNHTHPHPHPHPHAQHNAHPQHSHNGGVNGGGHPQHTQPHNPSSLPFNSPSTLPSNSPFSRPSPHHDPHNHQNGTSPSLLHTEHNGTNHSSNVSVTSDFNKDFSTSSAHSAHAARMSVSVNGFEDHSQLIGALTSSSIDSSGQQHVQQIPNVQQQQQQQQSNNMFDVSNPPPPRIIEAPVMSNGPNGGVGNGGLIRHGGQQGQEQAVRCPFCVNIRWMKSIKDAVDHMAMHVV